MRKTVLITGSSHGIGRALAIAFARQGYDVGVNGNKNVAMAQEVAEEVRACGARALFLKLHKLSKRLFINVNMILKSDFFC